MKKERNYKLYKTYSLKRNMALLGVAMCLIPAFTSCGKKDKENNDVSQTEITQQEEITRQEEKKVPLIREDGSELILLATLNDKNKTYTFNAGYLTFDKNGVYFDDAIAKKKIKLEDVLSVQPDTEFCEQKLIFCSSSIEEYIKEECTTNAINDIFEITVEDSDAVSKNIPVTLIENVLKEFTKIKCISNEYEPYMYAMDDNRYSGIIMYGINLEKMKFFASKKDALLTFDSKSMSEIYSEKFAEQIRIEDEEARIQEENMQNQKGTALSLTKKIKR